MEAFKFNKGMALMIRAVLNIDPATVEAQFNDIIVKAQTFFPAAKKSIDDFDTRIAAIEKNQRELIQLLQAGNHGQRNGKLEPASGGATSDANKTGGTGATADGDRTEGDGR